MKPRNAIKRDLFAAESRAPKIDSLGDPLVKISQVVDFAALASEVDCVSLRMVSGKAVARPFRLRPWSGFWCSSDFTIFRTNRLSFSCWID